MTILRETTSLLYTLFYFIFTNPITITFTHHTSINH